MYVHRRLFKGCGKRIATLSRVNEELRGWGPKGLETNGNNKYYSAELTMKKKILSKKAASLGYFDIFFCVCVSFS